LILTIIPLLALTTAAEVEPKVDSSRSVRDFNEQKQKYMALDQNKNYEREVAKLLPELLVHGDLTSQEVGIANVVRDQSAKYPLALLEGDNVNLVRVPSKVVQINGTVNEWVGKRNYAQGHYRPTGLFAAPGEFVTVTIPEDLVNKISVEIGHLHYQLKIRLKKAKQKIASPFGGLIILDLHDKNLGMFDVTVENAIEAPYFVYGKSTNEDWSRMKHLAVPWTILRVTGQMVIYIETLKVKEVTDMNSIMAKVKKSMDIYDELLGIPVGSQPGEESVYYDPLYSERYGGMGGVAHTYISYGSGGVVMCKGAGFNILHVKYIKNFIKNFNSYVVFHEIGHRGCYPDLPTPGWQYWAELVRAYIQVKRGVRKVNWSGHPWFTLRKMIGFKKYSNGKPCYEADTGSKFRKDLFFYQPNHWGNCWNIIFRIPLAEFGLDTLRKVISAYADKKKYRNIMSESGQIKSDRLAELYCKATGHNMIPFFNFFNLNINASVATSCPPAKPLPKMLTDHIKVASCIANKDIPDLDCVKMPEFQRFSKNDKGLCLISGTCQRDPLTTLDNSVDYLGGMREKKSEKRCHRRATRYMVRCRNDENHPITATYRFNNGRVTNKTVPRLPLPAGNCYKSNRRNVLVRNPIRYHVGRATTSDPYTECNEKCKAKNYSYFGLRNAKACWCGKWAPIPTSKLVMTKCNRMCTGNASMRCGGRKALNVWKVCTEANCSFSYE